MNETSPIARVARLVIKELTDEVLIYDLETDKAYCLNQTAALVWKNCDGNKTVTEITASVSVAAAAPVDEPVVWLALNQLEKFNLLAEVPATPAVFQGLNRRQLIRTLGMTAVALPAIISISAPNALAQSSKFANGVCCSGHGNCISNNCVDDPACNPTTGRSCQP